jgi:hypothetical protein
MVNAEELYAVEDSDAPQPPAQEPKKAAPPAQQQQADAPPPAQRQAEDGQVAMMVFTEKGEHVGSTSDQTLTAGAPLQLESGLYHVVKIKTEKNGEKKLIVKKQEPIQGGAPASAPATQQAESKPPTGLPAREPSAPRKKLFGKG